MSARFEILIIAGLLLAWIGIFFASAQGMLHVSAKVSDGLLAVLAALIAYRIWRTVRQWGRTGA